MLSSYYREKQTLISLNTRGGSAHRMVTERWGRMERTNVGERKARASRDSIWNCARLMRSASRFSATPAPSTASMRAFTTASSASFAAFTRTHPQRSQKVSAERMRLHNSPGCLALLDAHNFCHQLYSDEGTQCGNGRKVLDYDT